MRNKIFFVFSRLTVLILLLSSGWWPMPITAASQPLAASSLGCNVSGFISSDTTWSSASCDPYIVTGNIIVSKGVKLTIEAGTTIKFDSLKALTVQGNLVAIGTEANPITFTSNIGTPAKGDWGYIFFDDSNLDDLECTGDGSGSMLRYAIIEYAGGANTTENGALRIENSVPCIDHTSIRHNKADGIHVLSQRHATPYQQQHQR